MEDNNLIALCGPITIFYMTEYQLFRTLEESTTVGRLYRIDFLPFTIIDAFILTNFYVDASLHDFSVRAPVIQPLFKLFCLDERLMGNERENFLICFFTEQIELKLIMPFQKTQQDRHKAQLCS